jgi:hypothetical protein
MGGMHKLSSPAVAVVVAVVVAVALAVAVAVVVAVVVTVAVAVAFPVACFYVVILSAAKNPRILPLPLPVLSSLPTQQKAPLTRI